MANAICDNCGNAKEYPLFGNPINWIVISEFWMTRNIRHGKKRISKPFGYGFCFCTAKCAKEWFDKKVKEVM